MIFTYTGKNVDLRQSLKDRVEKKIGNKLAKYFSDESSAYVCFSAEHDEKKVEIMIPIKGGCIRAEETSDDMFTSIDLAADVLERQLVKYRKKLIDKYQAGGNFTSLYQEEAEEKPEDDEIRIVRTKRFDVKPMDPEEACLQMEMLGHNFFVFRNSDTDKIAVVYKRKGDTYGLIETE